MPNQLSLFLPSRPALPDGFRYAGAGIGCSAKYGAADSRG